MRKLFLAGALAAVLAFGFATDAKACDPALGRFSLVNGRAVFVPQVQNQFSFNSTFNGVGSCQPDPLVGFNDFGLGLGVNRFGANVGRFNRLGFLGRGIGLHRNLGLGVRVRVR